MTFGSVEISMQKSEPDSEDRICLALSTLNESLEAFLHSTEALNVKVLNFGQYGMPTRESTVEGK